MATGPSLLDLISPDTLVQLLGYLNHHTLAQIQPTSKTLRHFADLDTVWRPVARGVLSGRLCLVNGVEQRITSTESNPLSVSICRQALRDAVLDASRSVLSKAEICGLRFNMRIVNFSSLSAMHNDIPEDIPPVYVQFNEDTSCRTEGKVPGSSHPLFDWHSRWEFVQAMESLVPMNGGRSFRLPELRAPANAAEEALLSQMSENRRRSHLMKRNDFSCFHWYGRPPLKVWRHPENWSVCMTHINYQYSSFPLPARGADAALDNDQPYIHPKNLGPRDGVEDSDDDFDGDNEEDEFEDEFEDGNEDSDEGYEEDDSNTSLD